MTHQLLFGLDGPTLWARIDRLRLPSCVTTFLFGLLAECFQSPRESVIELDDDGVILAHVSQPAIAARAGCAVSTIKRGKKRGRAVGVIDWTDSDRDALCWLVDLNLILTADQISDFRYVVENGPEPGSDPRSKTPVEPGADPRSDPRSNLRTDIEALKAKLASWGGQFFSDFTQLAFPDSMLSDPEGVELLFRLACELIPEVTPADRDGVYQGAVVAVEKDSPRAYFVTFVANRWFTASRSITALVRRRAAVLSAGREVPDSLDANAAWSQLTAAMRQHSHLYDREKLDACLAIETRQAAKRLGYAKIASRTERTAESIRREFVAVYEQFTEPVEL